jgi:mannose-6-phosphate isomerase-like protein (cupin superfamily)
VPASPPSSPGAGAGVIRPGELPLEAEPENCLTYRRIVRRERHGTGLSMTWIALRGRHRRLVCHESDRVYDILSGNASFVLGEAPPQNAGAGDSVFIPRGTAYGFEGDIDYLVMNGPAFRPGPDEYLK